MALLGAGVLIGVLATGGDDQNTLSGEDFELAYPGSWQPLDDVPLPAEIDERGATSDVVGIDADRFLTVISFEREGSTPVSAGNVMAFAPALDRTFADRAKQLGGEVRAPAAPVLTGGLPALRTSFEYPGNPGGDRIYEATEIFGEARGYVIGCSYPAADPGETRAGCQLALETFGVSGEDE